MGDELNISVDLSRFRLAANELRRATGRTGPDILQEGARGFVRRIIDITPPGSAGTSGTAALSAGRAFIDRDLARIFTPVKFAHKRPEANPDVESIHRRLFAGKKPGRPIPLDRGRGGYYVDGLKLARLRELLYSRVGYLASGWMAAADRLGVRAPAWISRFGSRGSIEVEITPDGGGITITNFADPDGPVDELERRVPYALEYQANAMQRKAQYLLENNITAAGFGRAA